jgi:sugar lactone lactonase YvrE
MFDYTPETGLVGRRPFVELAAEDGEPDGITVDREGGVWVACWGAGAVRRFTAGGSPDEVVQVPGVAQVSACTLGGPALDRLYITTSRVGLDPSEAGQAGAVFVVDDVVPGLPVRPAQI